MKGNIPEIREKWLDLAGTMAVFCLSLENKEDPAVLINFAGVTMEIRLITVPGLYQRDNDEQFVEGLKEALNVINEWIEPYPLPGDGTDRTALRNGLIMVKNAISDLISVRTHGSRQPATN